ncbi:MAG: leucine--tRNA ligase [Candidatus Taylorbacteria bacterium]|nr:leucine--tRNA ligase [Candidatus Taylorbacteria bacterium]
MKEYDHKKIEAKWQKYWEKKKAYKALDNSKKPKFYALIEFPYPSGDGLHVGHPRPYIGMDIIARKRRMEGMNVLYPIGWDAFGLPTENYAIKTGIHPAIVTKNNSDNFRRQIKSLAISFDWSREINTTDPEYYKWTQWIFLQFLKRGLAYKKKMAINWCPKDKIGLANEEVVDGKCERCGTAVEKRDKEQWMLAITKYADRLDKDLDLVDYSEKIKTQQRNWIGRSEGAVLSFKLKVESKINNPQPETRLEVFTTRPDTLFGVTYVVLAPEHKLVNQLLEKTSNKEEVLRYIVVSKNKTEIERTSEEKDKTGIELMGVKAINPANGEEVPVWIADYVLAEYGTGAVMAVPAHDERDWDFVQYVIVAETRQPADGYIKHVVEPKKKEELLQFIDFVEGEGSIAELQAKEEDESFSKLKQNKFCYPGNGKMVNSGKFNAMDSEEAKWKITEAVGGKKIVKFKLRDWVFSRQHYWGEPIPVVFCDECKNRKYDVIVIHGYGSDSKKTWKPWLKAELEKRGHKVYCPDLPNTEKPNVAEQAEFILKNAKLTKNTIILGHSLGGPVMMRVLEKAKSKIYKAIFLDSVLRPVFPDKERLVAAADNWNFDFAKIKKMADEFVVLADDTFDTIRKEDSDELANIFDAREVMVTPVKGHFRADKEPEILKLFDEEGIVPVPEKDLPIKLPDVKKYQPTDTGESPLAAISKWVNTKCPRCGSPAKRETDTMPNWAGSSWYYLAYVMHKNLKSKILNLKSSGNLFNYWLPVDWYNGGMEHTTLHLLYSRFWHKFLFDLRLVLSPEPYKKRTSHGMILAEGGEKMSKSRGNVINPDEMVERFGADTLRMYEMFMGPFEQAIAWSTDGLVGIRRFLERVWRISEKASVDSEASVASEALIHKTIKKVGEDIENMRFKSLRALPSDIVPVRPAHRRTALAGRGA